METKKIVEINPLSRVEGDLKLRIEIENGKVSNAYVSGVMFRGFESILIGRDPMDSLVITPRVCGICGTAHLTSAVRALEMMHSAEVPPNATLIRNICMAVESVMNSLTHVYIMFNPDLINPRYSSLSDYEALKTRFAPFKGSSYTNALKERKRLLEIIAIFGGQWPHSHYMVPGGVACTPNYSSVTKALTILASFQAYLEKQVFGCGLEDWLNIKSLRTVKEFEKWNAQSDLDLFLRCANELGLDKIGMGCNKFLSFGGYYLLDSGKPFFRAGFFDGKNYRRFSQENISEHVRYSWYESYKGGKHPFEGTTKPHLEQGSDKYSWSKAPRYNNKVVEVGPLARQIISKNQLILDAYKKLGASVYTRMLARFHEIAALTTIMRCWLSEIDPSKSFYKKPRTLENGRGFGLIEAPRGALGHWSIVENGKIKNYQILTPTAWNASPRDSLGNKGPIEQALIGTPIADENNPIEVLHVVRSFDPCLVCTVHVLNKKFKYDYH